MAGTAAIVTYDAGAVRVSVVEKHPGGDRFRLIVPAVLVPVAMRFVPQNQLRKHAEENRRWLPVLQAASEELERCPDATLVEITGPDEHVSITKRGDTLFIDVEDPSDSVHISFPVRLVRTVANRLAAGSPPA